MNPDQWVNFINNLFVNPDGTRKIAEISLTIAAEGSELTFPNIEVAHSDSLQVIFQRFRNAEKETQQGAPAPQKETQERPRVANVEHIQHGAVEYLVYRMSDDNFRVVKPTGEEVRPKTIIYNIVVKKYREQFKI